MGRERRNDKPELGGSCRLVEGIEDCNHWKDNENNQKHELRDCKWRFGSALMTVALFQGVCASCVNKSDRLPHANQCP